MQKTISKPITKPTSIGSTPARIPPLPEGKHYSAKMTARDVEQMLLADGFRPIDAKTKRQLIAAGHWGMPEE